MKVEICTGILNGIVFNAVYNDVRVHPSLNQRYKGIYTISMTLKNTVFSWTKDDVSSYHHTTFEPPSAFNKKYTIVQSCIMSTYMAIDIMESVLKKNHKMPKL